MKPRSVLSTFALMLLASPMAGRAQPQTTLTTLHAFHNTDGANPYAALAPGSDGKFRGTTNYGGAHGDGTLFAITPGGVFTALHTFSGVTSQGTNPDGTDPRGGLIQARDGRFYGAAKYGGASGRGTIFSITPAGVFSTLYAFTALDQAGANSDGFVPNASLLQTSDGTFHGTAYLGGAFGQGTVFSITPAGGFTTLHSFTGGGDDRNPAVALIQGSDGKFYGATSGGGVTSGTVFSITPAGTLTTLYSFTPIDDSGSNIDGSNPNALVQGTDGNFYGTTSFGGETDDAGVDGNNDRGTVFAVSPSGQLRTLHVFSGADDGAIPFPGLIQADDGKFYGATNQGGNGGDGTLFSITPAGALTTLHSFTGADGANPAAALLQGSDGCFYGATTSRGSGGSGTIFRLAVAPDITSPRTATATAGKAFSYQIAATLHPAGYTASGLPAGLGLSQSTGLISGTPRTAGSAAVVIGAANAGGTTSATLTLTIQEGAPVITSAKTATTDTSAVFRYQITATGNPVGYGASGLPAGLAIDPSTGVISGTPAATGTFRVTISATSNLGTGSATLTLTVTEPLPVITSELNPPSRQGVAFNYRITATNNPTDYAASGVPEGLIFHTGTHEIQGHPAQAGTYKVTIRATNRFGTGTATLTLVVREDAPVITSALTAAATQGEAFTYTIRATNNPTSYGEAGLHAGLVIDQSTGVISGTPTKPGRYDVKIKAFNAGGSAAATLTITVKGAAPVNTSRTTDSGDTGGFS